MQSDIRNAVYHHAGLQGFSSRFALYRGSLLLICGEVRAEAARIGWSLGPIVRCEKQVGCRLSAHPENHEGQHAFRAVEIGGDDAAAVSGAGANPLLP